MGEPTEFEFDYSCFDVSTDHLYHCLLPSPTNRSQCRCLLEMGKCFLHITDVVRGAVGLGNGRRRSTLENGLGVDLVPPLTTDLLFSHALLAHVGLNIENMI